MIVVHVAGHGDGDIAGDLHQVTTLVLHGELQDGHTRRFAEQADGEYGGQYGHADDASAYERRRLQPGCVLVMLTARSVEMDVVVGLEAGADDYLVKPVRLAEFHARIRAHLRRGGATSAELTVRALGALVVDVPRHRVTIAGRELHLRPKEFDLLAHLAAQPEVAHSRERLMADVWDENWFGSTKPSTSTSRR